MKSFLFITILIFSFLQCSNVDNKAAKNDSKDYKDTIFFEDSKAYTFSEENILFNPLYNISRYIEPVTKETYISQSSEYEIFDRSVANSTVYIDSIFIKTKNGIVCFVNNNDSSSDSYTIFNYLGVYKSYHIIEAQYYENFASIFLDGKDASSYLMEGVSYFSNEDNYICTLSNYPYPLYFSKMKIFSYGQNITKLAEFWSDMVIEEVKWNYRDIFFQFSEDKWGKLNIDRLLKIFEVNRIQKEKFAENKSWYDIFYLYPFDESPDNIGTYYLQIEKEKESVFATSFGDNKIDFNYEIEPYCDNDTMFIVKKDSPEILARITKIGDDYFVQSDLIKVFSEYIIPEKYGYKLEKGFPND